MVTFLPLLCLILHVGLFTVVAVQFRQLTAAVANTHHLNACGPHLTAWYEPFNRDITTFHLASKELAPPSVLTVTLDQVTRGKAAWGGAGAADIAQPPTSTDSDAYYSSVHMGTWRKMGRVDVNGNVLTVVNGEIR